MPRPGADISKVSEPIYRDILILSLLPVLLSYELSVVFVYFLPRSLLIMLIAAELECLSATGLSGSSLILIELFEEAFKASVICAA